MQIKLTSEVSKMPRVKRNIEDGYNTSFAKRLRELIDDKGITQNQLSQIIGKTRQAINNYTLGNTAPDADTLIKLSKYFDVSVDYLLGLSDVKTTDKDIKYICEYIGLSVEAIEQLHSITLKAEQAKAIKHITSIKDMCYKKLHTEQITPNVVEIIGRLINSEEKAKENKYKIYLKILDELIKNNQYGFSTVIENINNYLEHSYTASTADCKGIEISNKAYEDYLMFALSLDLKRVVEEMLKNYDSFRGGENGND